MCSITANSPELVNMITCWSLYRVIGKLVLSFFYHTYLSIYCCNIFVYKLSPKHLHTKMWTIHHTHQSF